MDGRVVNCPGCATRNRVPVIAAQEGIATDGFRVVINNGPNGGEVVPHLHLHILGGKKLHEPMG